MSRGTTPLPRAPPHSGTLCLCPIVATENALCVSHGAKVGLLRGPGTGGPSHADLGTHPALTHTLGKLCWTVSFNPFASRETEGKQLTALLQK